MNIGIVGLGLLGGSFSLGLKSVEEGHRYLGVDIHPENARLALELGIADEILEFGAMLQQADLVVLATPVNVILKQLAPALEGMREDAILIDFGSTKELFCRAVQAHPRRARYVACHPIAGTENSGPESAFAGLLRHKQMIICDRDKSDPEALHLSSTLFKKLDMRISHMEGAEHDRHIAYVSHLSHISSFALGLTVLEKEKDERSIFTMAGSGFSSTVRLAKSAPDMWAPIFSQNTSNVSKALDAYIKMLMEFKEVIDRADEAQSSDLMRRANEIRRVLLGIDGR
jgi:prephenate dehydrogenase